MKREVSIDSFPTIKLTCGFRDTWCLLEILNKFHLSIEEGKINDKGLAEKLDRAITLLESQLKKS